MRSIQSRIPEKSATENRIQKMVDTHMSQKLQFYNLYNFVG